MDERKFAPKTVLVSEIQNNNLRALIHMLTLLSVQVTCYKLEDIEGIYYHDEQVGKGEWATCPNGSIELC
jgi:hypothetical protein